MSDSRGMPGASFPSSTRVHLRSRDAFVVDLRRLDPSFTFIPTRVLSDPRLLRIEQSEIRLDDLMDRLFNACLGVNARYRIGFSNILHDILGALLLNPVADRAIFPPIFAEFGGRMRDHGIVDPSPYLDDASDGTVCVTFDLESVRPPPDIKATTPTRR